MKDTILYRRFILVACFIAAVGMLLAGLIQQTRPSQRAFAPTIEHFESCGHNAMCSVQTASYGSHWG